MSRRVVVELEGTGHRLSYVRLLLEESLARGHETVLVLPPAWATLPEAGPLVRDLARLPGEPRVTVVTASDLRHLDEEPFLAGDAGADRLVVIPDADRHLSGRGLWRLARRHRLSLLLMRGRPEGARPRDRARFLVKRVLAGVLRARGHRVVVLASFLAPAAPGRVADPVVLHDDPDTRAQLAGELALDAERRWLGVFGALDRRKNLETVVAALTAGALDPDRHGLVLLGQVRPEYAGTLEGLVTRLDRHGVAVRSVPGFTSPERLDAAIALVDAVVVAYSNAGPSGIAARAAALGTRVLAAGSPTLREDAERVPDHVRWDELTPEGLVRLVQDTAGLPRPVPLPSGSTAFGDALL
ncbi:hypothetical protein [Nocardioides sp.]|uniref:hypothetical protein n=1 Tax=Nocardioides sp. TaxID=35761 RepID=UPI003516A15F